MLPCAPAARTAAGAPHDAGGAYAAALAAVSPEAYAAVLQALQGGDRSSGAAALERVLITRRVRPDVIIAAAHEQARIRMGVVGDEAWSVVRMSRELIQPHAGNFVTLKRALAIVSHALEEFRARTPEHAEAFLWHALRVLEVTAMDPDRDMAYAWPLLGIEDPGGRAAPAMPPVESAALAAWHRDAASLANARALARRGPGRRGDEGDGAGAAGAGGDGDGDGERSNGRGRGADD